MGKVIGIDLGTTNSCVAVLENNQPVVITNSEGQRTTPSVVAFTKNGERLVGEAAKRQAAVNVDRTFFSIKRQMGSDFRAKVDGKLYSAPEISSMILRKLKKDAEDYIGEAVTDAVITESATGKYTCNFLPIESKDGTTYYVKELIAPEGYYLDTNVHLSLIHI